MKRIKTRLNEAKKFHGHLGPYLILGILAGELAIKKLGCRKYFGISVKAWGVKKKPKSCCIDGLQLSTGATYGKGNIEKLNGREIKIEFRNRLNQSRLILSFQPPLIDQLRKAKTHRDSEALAKKLHNLKNYAKLFNLKLIIDKQKPKTEKR